MVRYVITEKGYTRYDELTDKLGKLDSKSSSWYTTLNELQVLDHYIQGDTRRITSSDFKPGWVSAFDRLVEGGYLRGETI